MTSKLKGNRGHKDGARQDSDTRAYAQPTGASKRGAENRKVSRMPHERDESASATGNRLDQTPIPSEKHIDSALDDVEQGRRDTERRGVPNDVPSASTNSSNARRSRSR